MMLNPKKYRYFANNFFFLLNKLFEFNGKINNKFFFNKKREKFFLKNNKYLFF